MSQQGILLINGTVVGVVVPDTLAVGKIATGATGTGITMALDDLTDVVISSPTSSQLLSYNGTNWVNATATSSPDYDAQAVAYLAFVEHET